MKTLDHYARPGAAVVQLLAGLLDSLNVTYYVVECVLVDPCDCDNLARARLLDAKVVVLAEFDVASLAQQNALERVLTDACPNATVIRLRSVGAHIA